MQFRSVQSSTPIRLTGASPAARPPRRGGIVAHPWLLLSALTLVASASTTAWAQSIALNVSDSTRITIAPNSSIAVPIRVDLSSAGARNLASLQSRLAWGSASLTLDSLRADAASGFELTTNLSNAPAGSLSFNAFSATALRSSGTLATAYYSAGSRTGGAYVTLTPTVAGDESGASVLGILRVRNLGVCIAPPGKWGDVTDDGTINVIDAQQIARYSVSLPVSNPAAMSARGDVNADGNVTIVDAQQIARYAVELSAAARIGTTLLSPPAVASIDLTPSGSRTLANGDTLTVVATPRDSSNTDVGPCQTITWSSSAPSVVSVTDAGKVTALGAGSATVTASSGGKSASVSFTVTSTVRDVMLVYNASRFWRLDVTNRSAPVVLDSVSASIHEADLHPDQDRVVYRRVSDNTGAELRMSTGAQTATFGEAWYPAYSAGGDSVVSGRSPSGQRVYRLRPSSATTDIAPCSNGFTRWADNNAAFLCATSTLWFVNAATGVTTNVPFTRLGTWQAGEWLNCPRLSADGSVIAFMIELGNPNQFYFVNRDGSNLRAVGPQGAGCNGSWSPRTNQFAAIYSGVIRIFDVNGTLVSSVSLPAGMTATQLAWR